VRSTETTIELGEADLTHVLRTPPGPSARRSAVAV
jgi:hypothetical protein